MSFQCGVLLSASFFLRGTEDFYAVSPNIDLWLWCPSQDNGTRSNNDLDLVAYIHRPRCTHSHTHTLTHTKRLKKLTSIWPFSVFYQTVTSDCDFSVPSSSLVMVNDVHRDLAISYISYDDTFPIVTVHVRSFYLFVMPWRYGDTFFQACFLLGFLMFSSLAIRSYAPAVVYCFSYCLAFF